MRKDNRINTKRLNADAMQQQIIALKIKIEDLEIQLF